MVRRHLVYQDIVVKLGGIISIIFEEELESMNGLMTKMLTVPVKKIPIPFYLGGVAPLETNPPCGNSTD